MKGNETDMNMELTIHRGSHEIGGSCVEIAHRQNRLVIDIGMPLVDEDGERFDETKCEGLSGPALVNEGILSDVEGLYKWQTPAPPAGLLLSHAHQDHAGFLRHVKPEIPVFCGNATRDIIELGRLIDPDPVALQNHHPLATGETFETGGFKITPYLMDHSAFDAYGFAVEAGGKTIIYSGDFRDHGRKVKALERFLDGAPREADALILEGTTLGRRVEDDPWTEQKIETEATQIARDTAGPLLLCLSSTNIDRLVTFYRASLQTDRLFVVDIWTAAILEALKEYASLPHPLGHYRNLRVFYPYWLCRRIADICGHEEFLYRFSHRKIDRPEIADRRKEIMMTVRPSMLSDLRRIDNLKGAKLIYSLWKGYLEEKRMKKLMDFAGDNDIKCRTLHTSGHAGIRTLKRVVKSLNPKSIIPIHTFHPSEYSIFGSEVNQINDGQTAEV
jgi:ribonuclease J